MKQFIRIMNIADYVTSCVQAGGVPVWAKKCAKVTARPGKPDEEVVTYTSTGLVETVNRVAVDEATGKPDWVVTNPRGERYIIRDAVFQTKYQPVLGAADRYMPKGQTMLGLQVKENIEFPTSWGYMKLERGGYLMIPVNSAPTAPPARGNSPTVTEI
jgi:hypothetical protein